MENKKNESGRNILDSLKRVGITMSIIALLLIFFSVSSLLSNLGGSVKESITGAVIVIQGSENKYNVSVTSKEIVAELNDNLACWIEGGLNEQDILVVGNILRDVKCPSADKKKVHAEVKDGCVVINVENEAVAELCSKENEPTINLELVKTPDVAAGFFPEDLVVPEKNVYWYILFFIVLIMLVLAWREFEFNIKHDLELMAEMAYLRRKNEKMKKAQKKEEKKPEIKEEVIVVSAPPIYDEEVYKRKLKEKQKIEEKLEKDSLMKKEERDLRRNKLISTFNKESEEINDLIISGELEDARKQYLELFEVYSELFALVGKKNKETLDRMMEYLCSYLAALEKIKGTRRALLREKVQRDDETIKPAPEVMTMERMNEMKDLIEKKKYDMARNMFYGAKVERMVMKDAAKNVVAKKDKDKLDEIEARHDKILKKGVVNVSQDDFYGFMQDMSELRKELKRKVNKSKRGI